MRQSIPDQDTFTTTEIAAMVSRLPRAINILFDCGRLQGYRDEQLERHVPQAEVVRFLEGNKR